MVTYSAFVISIVAALISMVCYGFVDFIPAFMVKRENQVKLAYWNSLIGALVLALIGIFFFRFPNLSNYDILLLIVASFASTVGLVSFFKGMKEGYVSIIVPISSSWSIIVAIVGIAFLFEAITHAQLYGILLVIIGTLLVSFKWTDLKRLELTTVAEGVKYALFAMLSWGVTFALVGILSKSVGWLWSVTLVLFGSFLILFVYSFLTHTDISFPRKITKTFSVYVVLDTIAFLMYGIGTNYGYLSIVGPITASAPLISLLLARLVLNERLETNAKIGVLAIMLGIILVAL